MHTRKIISMFLVLTLAFGPVLAWPDDFDDDQNYLPDAVDEPVCDDPDQVPVQIGECQPGPDGEDHFHPLNHDLVTSTVGSVICAPDAPTAPDCEGGYHTGPDTAGVEEEIAGLQQEVNDLLADLPDDPSDVLPIIETLTPLAYEALAQQITELAPEAVGTSVTMSKGDRDRDGDGVPDHYTLTIHMGTGPDSPAKDDHPIYLQSDFVDSDTGKAMILDPTTGQVTNATLNVTEAENGIIVLEIYREGDLYSTLTFDANDSQNTLVYRVHDPEDRYKESPRHPRDLPREHASEGDPVYFYAPMDQSYIRLLPLLNLDGDATNDIEEIRSHSHPINKVSLPENLDGDGCDVRFEPGATEAERARNDRDPNVCAPFLYDLEVTVPDLNPSHPDILVFNEVPVTFTAKVMDDLPPDVEAADVPKIQYWEMWLTNSTNPQGHHKKNATVDDTYGDYHADPDLHDKCDMLGSKPPAQNPQKGVNYDDDPVDHNHCPYFMDPDRPTDPTKPTYEATKLAGGSGLSVDALDVDLTLDTKLFPDSQYHIYTYVCLVGEACSEPFKSLRDVSDHFGITPHITIANKPVASAIEFGDVDGKFDRSGVQFTDLGYFVFSAQDPLREKPIAEVELSINRYTQDDDKLRPVGHTTYSVDVRGMGIGDERPVLVKTFFGSDECSTCVGKIEKVALLNESDPLAGATYNLTFNSTDLPWQPDERGGSFNLKANAYIAATDTMTPFARVSNWPNIVGIDWFNNAPPALQDLSDLGVTPQRSAGTASLEVKFRYIDPDEGNGAPDVELALYERNGTDFGAFVELPAGTCTKASSILPTSAPPPDYNAVYTCTYTTSLFGEYKWKINVTDVDRGNNSVSVDGGNVVIIPNEAPTLSDAIVEPDTTETADEGSRVMRFEVRYTDPDDAPERVWVELYDGRGDDAAVIGNITLEEATDCFRDATTSDETTTDVCAKHELEFGNYSVRFFAESLRPGNASYPTGWRYNFTVGDLVRIDCHQCGSNTDTMNRLTNASRTAMRAANEILLDLPPIPHHANPQTVLCKYDCNPNDSDEDGYTDEAEENFGTDPEDSWQHPNDRDADMWPRDLDNGPIDMNIFTVREGHLAFKQDGHITVYETTEERLTEMPWVLNVSWNRDNEFYNISVLPDNDRGFVIAGVAFADYRFTEGGFRMAGYDQEGTKRLEFMFDTEKIGSDSLAARLWVVATPAQIHEVGLYTSPLGIEVNGEVTSAPVGMQKEPDGTYSFWTDLDGDGEKEPVPPETVDTSDDDGDGVPDVAEALICTAPIPQCDGNDFTPPGGVPGLPPNCGIGQDYDCDGAADWDEIQQGCNPFDPQSNPTDGCEGGDIPPDGTPDPVNSLTCSGYGATEPVELVGAILSDADCDGRANEEEIPDGNPLDPDE